MTKISRIPLPKEDWEEFYEQLCNALALLETKKDIKDFLDDLLTYTEKRMVSKRVQVARSLINGITYNLIGTRLHVTDTMISAVNDVLNTRGMGYVKIDNKLNEIEENRLYKSMRLIKKARIASIRGN